QPDTMLPRARLKQHGGSAVRRAPAARTQARLLADLLADLVLLLVERLLLGLGDVAAVGARHGALFLADGAVLAVQLGRLRLGELPFLALLMDALVLVGEPIVHLRAARVRLLPLRVGHGVSGEAAERQRHGSDAQSGADGF